MFLIFTNADDTTLFCNLEDIDSDNKKFILNRELQHVHEWLLTNGLQLNVKKIYILFHKQNKIITKLNLRINNNIINEIDQFNFLGTLISCFGSVNSPLYPQIIPISCLPINLFL